MVGRLGADTGDAPLAVVFFTIGQGLGLAMPPATEAIMGALPREKAGIGSAMNDVVRELGGTLGIAVLGSVLTSSYRSSMEGTVAGLPAPIADAASDSVGAAHGVAADIGGAVGVRIARGADSAFVDALGTTATFGAGAAFVGAMIALALLPARDTPRRRTRPDAAAEPAASTPMARRSGTPPPARCTRPVAELARRACALAAAVLVIAAAGATVPMTAVGATGRVCVNRLAVVTSPGGYTVGYVFRGDRVRITRRSAHRRWERIFSADELHGWVRTSNSVSPLIRETGPLDKARKVHPDETPSLRKMFVRCVSTVLGLRKRAAAISAFVLRSTTSSVICSSRSVSDATPSAEGRPGLRAAVQRRPSRRSSCSAASRCGRAPQVPNTSAACSSSRDRPVRLPGGSEGASGDQARQTSLDDRPRVLGAPRRAERCLGGGRVLARRGSATCGGGTLGPGPRHREVRAAPREPRATATIGPRLVEPPGARHRPWPALQARSAARRPVRIERRRSVAGRTAIASSGRPASDGSPRQGHRRPRRQHALVELRGQLDRLLRQLERCLRVPCRGRHERPVSHHPGDGLRHARQTSRLNSLIEDRRGKVESTAHQMRRPEGGQQRGMKAAGGAPDAQCSLGHEDGVVKAIQIGGGGREVGGGIDALRQLVITSDPLRAPSASS